MYCYSRRLMARLCCFLLFFSSLLLCLGVGQLPSTAKQEQQITNRAAVSSAQQQVQQGVLRYQSGNYDEAINTWEGALSEYQKAGDRLRTAIVLENLARAYQQIGQMDRAIQTWQQSTDLYRQMRERQKVGRSQTEQAQVYSRLGQHRQAISLLCSPQLETDECIPESSLGIARILGDRIGEAAALGSLGNAYWQQGAYDQAIARLEQGLAISQKLENQTYQAATLNSLGNAHVSRALLKYRRANSFREIGYLGQAKTLEQDARADDAAGLKYFQAAISTNTPHRLRALLNIIPVYYRANEAAQGTAAHQQARETSATLPDSQEKALAAITLANLLQPESQTDQLFSQTYCLNPTKDEEAQALLRGAIATTQNIGDRRVESFALGELGHLYECRQSYDQALELTQQARWAAEDLNAADSLYLWEWQTGRILNAKGQPNEAINAYEQALSTLERIRTDIVIADRNLQFDFRDTVEPIYRELAQLRLQGQSSPSAETDNIGKVLKTVDALKLAELQNYFGDECAISALPETTVEQVDPDRTTAVLSTLMLGDRTAVILTLPDQQREVHWVSISDRDLREAVNRYRLGLEKFYQPYDAKPAQLLYDWLIRPFESSLQAQQVKTLVFVQDGIFRSVPMAALHDGQQFLVEKYAIATTPFFKLPTPQTLNRQRLKALALGLSETATINQREYDALTYVKQEISNLQTLLPQTQPLLNQQFTRDRLQQELNTETYPIVHIATHAEFGPEPRDTFLIIGNNQVLTINELDTLLRSASTQAPIELLTLTACRTAVGDDRAALGLAGMALQAGAKSAIASLWYINDQATAQVADQFYRELLKPGATKAEALRMAQLSLINTKGQTSRPGYWAPFILIGNWL